MMNVNGHASITNTIFFCRASVYFCISGLHMAFNVRAV